MILGAEIGGYLAWIGAGLLVAGIVGLVRELRQERAERGGSGPV
jgi:hypothetical protein